MWQAVRAAARLRYLILYAQALIGGPFFPCYLSTWPVWAGFYTWIPLAKSFTDVRGTILQMHISPAERHGSGLLRDSSVDPREWRTLWIQPLPSNHLAGPPGVPVLGSPARKTSLSREERIIWRSWNVLPNPAKSAKINFLEWIPWQPGGYCRNDFAH